MKSLSDYRRFVPEPKISDIYRKATDISSKHVLNINSTYYGGGVAEMLKSTIPLMNDVGIKTGWRTVVGSRDFFQVTKKFHNALQGEQINFNESIREVYERTNVEFARFTHIDHDLVVIHDPQPLPLIQFYDKHQPWVWRCHIDLSTPNEDVWNYLRSFALKYDTTAYQLEEFAAEDYSNHSNIIHPAIDPLTPKNQKLSAKEVREHLKKAGVDPQRPFITQVSRFDRWKDPKGVLNVYRKVREEGIDCQLVMIGGIATDDPEGPKVYREVEKEAEGLEDVNLIVDAPDILVNAVQKASDVVLQLSKKEGFGLTVTEAMWKRTPVVATDVGGLKLQVEDGKNGHLVSPGNYGLAANKVIDLLRNEGKRRRMGENARQKVKENFLITRLVEDWIEIWRDLLL